MRLFVAIDIPDSLKELIVKIQQEIKEEGVKLADTKKAHLTLAFYKKGDVKELTEKIKKISFEQFYIKVKGFGLFPGHENPRLLWLGIDYNQQLCDLKKQIKHEEFTPHITIARLKKADSKKIIQKRDN